MSPPTFIGIGAQRAGSTWLHELLASHPEIYVPTRRKEVHFFDWYYERGDAWYATFFPSAQDAERYHVLGEITPDYLYEAAAPERIFKLVPTCKLLVILRNPVDRAYSHYAKLVRDDNWQATFDDSLVQKPELIERGFYSKWLKNYLSVFPREQLLPLVYETAVRDIEATKAQLSDFLGVSQSGFPEEAGRAKVHESHVPKLKFLYAASKEAARWLHRYNFDAVVNVAGRAGVKNLYGKSQSLPSMPEATRRELLELYADDVKELQKLIGINLDIWKNETYQDVKAANMAAP